MAPCKLKHEDPQYIADAGVPRELCRRCNPGKVLTPAQRVALDAADAEKRRVALAERERQYEIDTTKRKLNALENKHGVGARVAEGLRRKLERIEAGGPLRLRRRKGKR